MGLQEKMFALVEEYHQSGLSTKLFCERKGIAPSRFYYWIRKKKDQNKTGFIKITTDAKITSVPVELIYPNGVRLQLPVSDLDVITVSTPPTAYCRVASLFLVLFKNKTKDGFTRKNVCFGGGVSPKRLINKIVL